MVEAETSAPADQVKPSQDSERRCLVTGAMLGKDDMIRFVVGPDHNIIPDLAEDLPGRGMWVTADSGAITSAATKGLFSKAAKTSVKADPKLADRIMELLRRRCLSFLGMAKGAGIIFLGQTEVETAMRAKKLGLLVVADDAKGELDSRDTTPLYKLFGREELGASLGFAQIVYAGLKPHGLTTRLRLELDRLEKMIKSEIRKTIVEKSAI